MSSRRSIEDNSDLAELSPLARLHVQLEDLLRIHVENTYAGSLPQSASLNLTGLQYVYGEKSVEKSCMRFIVKLSPEVQGAKLDDVIVSLEFVAKKDKTHAG